MLLYISFILFLFPDVASVPYLLIGEKTGGRPEQVLRFVMK
jgi:hypothetical protein